ncbi:OmpA/MotB domain protein [Crinalium epipsammum PCC 9333]|uniref:OmpA/MotB domain protein n=1 Tax=Crinalium epipsammum PCC 9333 TaxID=1173022 RepID=K9VXS8_9CYAN|nr:OmpA family protein [Crinalium epipsammum]AFZ12766.1 OmpA/MotB domain protein [Crinalium epipsammum PCC 9333]
MSNFSQFDVEPEVEEQDDSSFLLSIGDLMSGLLMLFALLFIIVQMQLSERIQEVKRLETELAAYKKAIDELPIRILNAINGNVGGKGVFIVDPKTGDVSIAERLLFDEGSAELKPEGKKFLQEFIPVYSQVIFSNNKFDEQITRIVIEGHTSSEGSDKVNLELSLRRSLSVSDYIFSNQLNFKTKGQLRNKILAAGRGEIDANQKIDNPSDRKVVFRFQFKREDFSKWFPKTRSPVSQP